MECAPRQRAGWVLAVLTVLVGCTAAPPTAAPPTATPPTATPPPATPTPTASRPTTAAPTPSRHDAAEEVPRLATRPRPTRMRLSIPAIGLRQLRVVAYRGTADDRPGTLIQDRGLAATPRGPRGGVGPGEIGNMVLTAHRTAAGRPFGRLPALRLGEHILVMSRDQVYDYRVTRSMTISFRSTASRLSQSAPVPGRLGVTATRPMITLSTCATPEDHAVGNYWSDVHGNPEHRIDKVGVLVDVRPR